MIVAWLLTFAAFGADRTLCFNAETLYLDVGLDRSSEDYYSTNDNNKKLRGLRIYYRPIPGAIWSSGYADYDGANAGCIVLDLDPTLNYEVKVETSARVDGHDIVALKSDLSTPSVWEISLGTQSYAVDQVYAFHRQRVEPSPVVARVGCSRLCSPPSRCQSALDIRCRHLPHRQ